MSDLPPPELGNNRDFNEKRKNSKNFKILYYWFSTSFTSQSKSNWEKKVEMEKSRLFRNLIVLTTLPMITKNSINNPLHKIYDLLQLTNNRFAKIVCLHSLQIHSIDLLNHTTLDSITVLRLRTLLITNLISTSLQKKVEKFQFHKRVHLTSSRYWLINCRIIERT